MILPTLEKKPGIIQIQRLLDIITAYIAMPLNSVVHGMILPICQVWDAREQMDAATRHVSSPAMAKYHV